MVSLLKSLWSVELRGQAGAKWGLEKMHGKSKNTQAPGQPDRDSLCQMLGDP